jgi:hypothetical protein
LLRRQFSARVSVSLATQGGVKVKLRPTGEPLPVLPLQLVTAPLLTEQDPDIALGTGWPMVQPEPESEAVTLPEMSVGTMVPVIVPLMEQLLQANENGMEKVPLVLTTVVPEELAGQLRFARGTPAITV